MRWMTITIATLCVAAVTYGREEARFDCAGPPPAGKAERLQFLKQQAACMRGDAAACQASQCDRKELLIDGSSWHCSKTSCYHFGPDDTRTKAEADNICREMGGHLLAIETAEEQLAIEDFISKYDYRPALSPDTGMRRYLIDLVNDVTWSHSGDAATYTNWISNLPLDANEKCTVMSYDHSWQWNHVPCSQRFAYICERK